MYIILVVMQHNNTIILKITKRRILYILQILWISWVKFFDGFSTTVTRILEEMKEICKENFRIANDNIKLTQEIFDLKYRLDGIDNLALNLLSK